MNTPLFFADVSALFLILFVGWIFCGILGAAVARGNPGLGFILGALLGPLGVIAAAVVGSRPSGEPAALRHHPGSTAAPANLTRQASAFADLPSQITVRRSQEIIATLPLCDFLDRLHDGSFLPTDYYLHIPGTNAWRRIGNLMK